jgi:hypothetical protein
MIPRKLKLETGQSLVIIALGMVAFVAILALVLDGANAYAAKRQAQNAADAGALAGASYMCKYRDADGGEEEAKTYAVKNGSGDPLAYADLSSGTVVVTATVQRDTFFAGVLGFDLVTPRAVAEAQCRPPIGIGVLPVAWSCRNNVIAGEELPGIDCEQVFGPCDDLSCIYIVMDSNKLTEDVWCDELLDDNGNGVIDPEEYSIISDPPPGSKISVIDCDIDDDGVNELKTGGDRSWLDLDGGGNGANQLKDWLSGGYSTPIDIHTWLPQASGNKVGVYNDNYKLCTSNKDEPGCIVGEDVILPVFDKYCNGTPTIYPLTYEQETRTYCEAGTYDHMDLIDNGSNNYHVISFSTFHVTCLQAGNNKAFNEQGKTTSCPGNLAAATKSLTNPDPQLKIGDPTIEGYFIDEQLSGYSGNGNMVDTGTFVVVLVR